MVVVNKYFVFMTLGRLLLLFALLAQTTQKTMRDLRAAGVDVLTLGQYLRPTDHHLAVVEYVTPEKFDEYAERGESMGFSYVASGPMVRSSYKAGEFFMENMIRRQRDGGDGGGEAGQVTADKGAAAAAAVLVHEH